MLRFDDEGSRRLVAAYLTPDVVAQRRSVRGWLELRPGERVLDVGVGPGFLAAEMARRSVPTAWSRGSTSAIGCWRSRKGSTPRLTCGRGRPARFRIRTPAS